jgi:hypothetical protein
MQVEYPCRNTDPCENRDRQTDIDGLIRCSSLTLEHEEHLKMDPKIGWEGVDRIDLNMDRNRE